MWILRDETNRRGAVMLWASAVLLLWLLGTKPVQAQGVRPAEEPIVSARLGHVLDMIPGSATDLPPYLAKSQDVYLLITAGASYTDIQVLANPEVSAPQVAQALSSALAGTPLRGQPVEWSADSYSAAQVSVHHNHFGAVRASNTVPFGPLMSGLRQSGLTPHLLLRVPAHGRTLSVARSRYGTRAFRWYDIQRLGSQRSLTVTARLTWISLARMLGYYLLIPIIALLGLRLAHFLSSRGQTNDIMRRQLFRSISTLAVTGSVLAQVGGMMYLLLRTPTPAAIADLWFGSSTTMAVSPFLAAGVVPLILLLILGRKQEIRRFGLVATGPAIPMSDEEKAVRKRVTQWSALPHMIGAVVMAVALFAVPRRSPLYSFVHPIAIFLPVLGAGLVPWLFQKRLNKFTQKTLDDNLTWRARQLGQQLSVRMPDVFVEDSSRAAHLAFASHQGHHITLSRKLQETFTPAETDFVLAHHLSCMKKRTGNYQARIAVLTLLIAIPLFAPVGLLLWLNKLSGAATPTSFIISPWFFVMIAAYMLIFLSAMTSTIKSNTCRSIKQTAEADRDALEATGNLAAAESALDKIVAGDMPVLTLAGRGSASNPAYTKDVTRAGRVLLRRLELHKTAQALGLEGGSGTGRNATS